MKLGETVYTQLTDRQLSISKRLDLIEQVWSNESKQMIFDWLAGLILNRKKSGLDSNELVHRVWKQLRTCLKEKNNEQITIKPSFIKTLIDTLGNETGEANQSAIDCCLLIGTEGKELDYKYEQLVDLLKVVLTKYQENEQLITMALNKYSTAIRVQGNLNKIFVDLCKQLLSPLLNIRSIYSSLSTLIDDILKYTLFHRTWITTYRDYIQSVLTKKNITCPVSPLFTALESLILSENVHAINFLPQVFRHCINLIDQEKVSEIYEFLVRFHSWIDQIKTNDLYIDGIRQILQILDEKHLIDQLLIDSFEEKLTSLMKDILFKRQISSLSLTYANLCVVCLHLHPKLIENNLSTIIEILQPSTEYLSIFLTAYIDLYSQMRSLVKLPKRLINIFDKSSILYENVLDHYRLCISKCSHTLIDEIWSSLLDQFDQHLIVIQLISSLLNGYRLFDLNISRDILIEQNQLKYNRTLEKLRSQINDSILTSTDSTTRLCILQCYLSLGWFSLCLLSFSSSIPSVDDILNHNGFLLTQPQWSLIETDENLQSIIFSLNCQRLYRSLAVDEREIDENLIDNLWKHSSKRIFNEFEPFFDLLSKSKQLKLMRIFLEHFSSSQLTFITNEYRLQLIVQAIIDLNLHDENREKKRRKIDFDQDPQSFYEHLKSKTCSIDKKIQSIFSIVNFDRIQSIDLLITIAWLCLQTNNSAQILVDILSASKIFPLALVEDVFQYVLNENIPSIVDQILVILTKNYQTIVENKRNEIVRQMKINSDSENLRLLEKSARLFTTIRSNDLEPIVDRLIQSFSHSTISFSSMDSRYLLAMIILNCFQTFDKYKEFFKQIWKLLARETNDVKQVIIAFAKQWKDNYSIEDLNVFVKWLDREYDLLTKICIEIDENLFRQWIEQIEELKFIQTLAHCDLKKEKNDCLMTKIHSNLIQCGTLILESTTANYSTILQFFVEILQTKKVQLRSQIVVSALQSILHLPNEHFFENHSNICKILSLLIKHHHATLCKHVATVETILKLLFQSIIKQSNENEQILEAARDTTKLTAHLIEQCKDDFRSTLVYVLVDYIHSISKGVYLSPQLKKSLHNIAFELFRLTSDRIEQYISQMPISERELLKQLHQQYEQYHMFKGTV